MPSAPPVPPMPSVPYQSEDTTRAPRRGRRLVVGSALALALGGGLLACSTVAGAAPGPVAPDVSVRNVTAAPSRHEAPPMTASEPTRLVVPAAGVDTSPVLRLGLDAEGGLQVPSVDEAEQAGWYTGGVTPGEKGPAVLVAHYDTAKGPALLRDVAKVRTGDLIRVGRADGSTAVFEVREIQQVDKKDFPTNKVYGKTDRPELRLITCGGPIADGHRTDNIILFAGLVK
ncbi:class F sortase [Streptomyces sp. NPDC026092]|uniref:class F sortase n=1 Tax=Streptomyces sp. NPDC026092 TaxID=3154797 RepID=UPI0033C71468